MTDGSHRSIGEVLNLLQDEFTDVTISKIRFLESQGLIDPERTPSGYRKFTEADIARLRWILRQQRENFLPLKVIKDRLDDPELARELAGNGSVPGAGPGGPSEGGPGAAGDDGTAGDGVGDGAGDGPASRIELPVHPPRPSILDRPPKIDLTLEELCRDTGLTSRNVGELERYGLLSADTAGRVPTYGYDALVVARAAAALRAQGVEARHLRMYKVAAEREAGYYEQLLMPVLKGRSTRARREAADSLDALLAHGDEIRGALLRQAFREHFPGT